MALGLGLDRCRGMATGKGEPARGWAQWGGLAGRHGLDLLLGPQARVRVGLRGYLRGPLRNT